MALVYASLGDRAESFQWLEKAYRTQDSRLVLLNVEPAFLALHVDLRFGSMLRKIGLGR
jgi:hypothetical protein